MKIVKLILMLLTMFIVSMYFFPFNFTALPSQPTKNYLAAIGLVSIVLTFLLKGNMSFPKEVIVLLLLAGGVSVISYISVVYNHTPDYSYVTYVRAAIIWLCAAYVVALTIRLVHGYIDAKLIVDYLVAVCVFQCAMAMLIEFVPAVQMFVDAHVSQGQSLLKGMERLYGIGAYLDIGGSRFAVVLVAMAAVVSSELKQMKVPKLLMYGTAFAIITVIGNMIARTTIVGVILSIGLFVMRYLQGLFGKGDGTFGRVLVSFGMVLAVFIPAGIILYRTFPDFQDLMEFGFEGIFNYFEGGELETASTNTLKSMIVFPENISTWIIGDGYFANSRFDQNYLGDATTGGFYMGTDIGYLRFIFYAGIFCLIAMSAVIIYAANICIKAIPDYKILFILAAAVNFIVWFKVATDIFLFFCLFICANIIYETLDAPEEIEEDDEDELNEEECEDDDYDGSDEEDDGLDDEDSEKVPLHRYPGAMPTKA